ncbi:MAG: hypothetical protein ABI042_16755 [Verrucomicrobiota bacterium]
MTLVVQKVSPFSVGVLIALFERAVGFYASLINVNDYHQPGVEDGKKAAENDHGIAIENSSLIWKLIALPPNPFPKLREELVMPRRWRLYSKSANILRSTQVADLKKFPENRPLNRHVLWHS